MIPDLEGFTIDDQHRWNIGNTCFWCGRDTHYGGADDERLATRDHLLPRAHGGGKLEKALIAVACKRCNNKRGSNMKWRPYVPTENAQRFLHAIRYVHFRVMPHDMRTVKRKVAKENKRKVKIKAGQKRHGI